MMEFKIKECRKSKNISLYKLSKSSGISISYLRDLENNRKSNPSLLVIYKIALLLNVHIEDLFYTDLENLRKLLYETIERTGYTSKETISISNLIDIIISKSYNK